MKKPLNKWVILTQHNDYVQYTDYVDCGDDWCGSIMVAVNEERGPFYDEIEADNLNQARAKFWSDNDLDFGEPVWTRRIYLCLCERCGEEYDYWNPFPDGDNGMLNDKICFDCLWEEKQHEHN